MKAVFSGATVFVAMAILTWHVHSGLLHGPWDLQPRAIRGLDAFLNVVLVSPVGEVNAVYVMSILTVVFSYLAYRRQSRLTSQAKTPPPTGLAAMSGEEVAESLMKVLERHEDIITARKAHHISVRLIPQLPIRDNHNATSWFGGCPHMPPDMPWPEKNGEPLHFIAQIDCSKLPESLWDGLGPREGWLLFFMENYRNAKIIHTSEFGVERRDFTDICNETFYSSDICSISGIGYEYIIKSHPKWPLDIIPIVVGGEDPYIPRNSDWTLSNDNPDFIMFNSGHDLNDPAYQPYNAQTALTLLDMLADIDTPKHYRFPECITGVLKQIDSVKAYLDEAEKLSPEDQVTSDNVSRTSFHQDEIFIKKADLERLEKIAELCEHISQQYDICKPQIQDLVEIERQKIFSKGFSHEEFARFCNVLVNFGLPTIKRNRTKIKLSDGGMHTLEHPFLAEEYLGKREAKQSGFAYAYDMILRDHAKHDYVNDPASLPSPLLDRLLPVWKSFIDSDMGFMGDIPHGYVYDYEPDEDVVLLEIPTSKLMKWIWGDVNTLVITISKEALRKGDFDALKFHISN